MYIQKYENMNIYIYIYINPKDRQRQLKSSFIKTLFESKNVKNITFHCLQLIFTFLLSNKVLMKQDFSCLCLPFGFICLYLQSF